MKRKGFLFLLILLVVTIFIGCELFNKPSALLGTWQYQKEIIYPATGGEEIVEYPSEPDENGFRTYPYVQFSEDSVKYFRKKFKDDESIVYLFRDNPLMSLSKNKYSYANSGKILHGTYTIAGENVTLTEVFGEGETEYTWVIKAKRVPDSEVADWIPGLP